MRRDNLQIFLQHPSCLGIQLKQQQKVLHAKEKIIKTILHTTKFSQIIFSQPVFEQAFMKTKKCKKFLIIYRNLWSLFQMQFNNIMNALCAHLSSHVLKHSQILSRKIVLSLLQQKKRDIVTTNTNIAKIKVSIS